MGKVHHWPEGPPADHLGPDTERGTLWCGRHVGPKEYPYQRNFPEPKKPIAYKWSRDSDKVTCGACLRKLFIGVKVYPVITEVT